MCSVSPKEKGTHASGGCSRATSSPPLLAASTQKNVKIEPSLLLSTHTFLTEHDRVIAHEMEHFRTKHHRLGENCCSEFAVESGHLCSLLSGYVITEQVQNPEEGNMEVGKL